MSHRNPTAYTMIELKKMSTERLMNVHVAMFGAFPNTFDRHVIINAVWDWTQEAAAWWQFIAERGNDHRQPQHLLMVLAKSIDAKAPKFSDHDVKQMRIMKRAGYGYRFIATTYGTSPAYAKKVVDGKLYKHVS